MAIAAAEPAPAEVMTWARGSTTLPAAHTPGLLVRPVASTVTKPASSRSQPRAASEAVGVGDVAGPDEHRGARDDAAVGEFDAAQPVVLDDEPRDDAVLDADAAGVELAPFVVGELVGVGEEDDVVGPLPDEQGVQDRAGDACRARRGAGRGPPSRGSTGSAAGRGPSARGRRGCRAARR